MIYNTRVLFKSTRILARGASYAPVLLSDTPIVLSSQGKGWLKAMRKSTLLG